MTSGYVYDSAEQAAAAFKGETENFVYSRYGNPTLQALEARLAKLEGAEACRVCVGQVWQPYLRLWHASFLQVTGLWPASFVRRMPCNFNQNPAPVGVDVELVDGRDLAAWTSALGKPTKIVFLESPSNPVLHLVDIQAVSALAHAAGAQVIVDNVFATPVFQSPLALGADIVTYSTTKHIDGQGRLLGVQFWEQLHLLKRFFCPFTGRLARR